MLLPDCTRPAASETGGSRDAASHASAGGAVGARTGQELYDRYCRLCHGVGARGYAADNAPSLVSPTFLESATDDFIAHGIRAGRPDTAMAAYGRKRGGPLSEDEIRAIIAYLRSKGPRLLALPKQPTHGDPTRGAALFGKECKKCHGPPPQRRSALDLRNPELVRSASAEFLRHAIEQGRPPTRMPAFKSKLADSEIDDLVAWLLSPPPAKPSALPPLAPEIPNDLPLVLNPSGASPKFTLRDDRYVPAEQLSHALQEKKRLILIDARAPSDWLLFHIPGAVPIPYYDTARLSRVPNDGTWVVAYCACPHHASGEVIDALRKRNFPHTAVLDEGILVWRQQGYPVTGTEVAPKPTKVKQR